MITITLPCKNTLHHHQERLAWLKENCPSYINHAFKKVPRVAHLVGGSKRNMVMHIPTVDTYSEFYFSDERDASLFALRWS